MKIPKFFTCLLLVLLYFNCYTGDDGYPWEDNDKKQIENCKNYDYRYLLIAEIVKTEESDPVKKQEISGAQNLILLNTLFFECQDPPQTLRESLESGWGSDKK